MAGHTIIGVFDEAGEADRTIDALQNAGFNNTRVYRTGGSASTGGFLAGLRNFFGGNEADESGTHVANALEGMGVTDNEANYYENEYNSGHSIVALQADNNAENAWSIMQTNGAYNYASRMGGSGITNTSTNTTDATRTGTTTAYNTTDATRTGPTEYTTTDATRTGTTTNYTTTDDTRTGTTNTMNAANTGTDDA